LDSCSSYRKIGRTQTSIITVVVTQEDNQQNKFEISKKDVEQWVTKGTGSGGQKN